MSIRSMTPALAAAVERARQHASATGELLAEPSGSFSSPFDPDEREVVAAWHSSGDYDRIVAELVADDPDLATQ